MKNVLFILFTCYAFSSVNAHAKDGFCERIRMAEVKGSVLNNRFVATFFKLLPETSKNN